MKKQLIIGIWAVLLCLCFAAVSQAELTQKEFLKQLIELAGNMDAENIKKLVSENPNIAKIAYRTLEEIEVDKIAKPLAQLLSRAMQFLQLDVPATDSAVSEMSRLNEEGQKAFYAANYLVHCFT